MANNNLKSRLLGVCDGFNAAVSIEHKQQENQIKELEHSLQCILAVEGLALSDSLKLERVFAIANKRLCFKVKAQNE